MTFKKFENKQKKKKKNTEEVFVGKIRYPKKDELEMFAVVTQRMGSNKIMCSCADGKERNVRIPGKMKKKIWVRDGDLVIVKLWDFQQEKANLVWRYLPTQTERIKKQGLLKNLPI